MLYSIARKLIWFLGKVFFDLKVYGVENIPTKGGLIIASNHVSFLDPPIIGTVIRHRKVYFLARSTLFKPIFSAILKNVHAVPINTKTGFKKSLNEIISLVKEGKAVVIFPEGTRSKNGKIQKGKDGIGFLVNQTNVSIVPAYIEGTYNALPRGKIMIKLGKIRVFFGKIITFNKNFYNGKEGKEKYRLIVNKIMETIKNIQSTYNLQ